MFYNKLISLRPITIITFVIGLLLFSYSFTLSYYTDTNLKAKLDTDSQIAAGQDNFEEFKDHYFKEISKIETNKKQLMDMGSGIAIAAASFFIFLLAYKIKYINDLKNIKIWKRKWIFIISNIAWLLLIPASEWYYSFTLWRGDYPWFADTIAIPLMGAFNTAITGLIFFDLLFSLMLIKGNFKNHIFIKAEKYTFKEVLKETVWALTIALFLLILISIILSGDHFTIPVFFLILFILLMLRGSQIEEKKLN